MARKAEAKDLLKPVEAVAAANQETVEAVVKAGEEAAKGYDKAVAATKAQAVKASAAALENYDEFAKAGKDAFDAYMQSSTAMAKAVETLSKEILAFTQVSFENNAAAAKALMGAKTFQEVVELQTEYSRKNFDSIVAESSKLTELSVDIANQAIEPLKSQANQSVERLWKPLAA